MQLKQGTLLQKGKYKIEKCLGQGSFGITYLAKTKLTISGGKGKTSTWVDVAIKEFFMKDFNCRQPDGSLNESSSSTIVEKYKKDFKKEADNLAKMEHPGIVDILDSFEENNTCYLVMAYIDGKSLDAYIADKGAIPENEGLQYIEKIADALHYMHCQHMLHLDLKPKNIMRNKENDTFIIDFGLSKQYDENDEPESSTTLGQGTQGYAPIEQGVPHSGHDFPVTIDVYALGATFYKILTGKTPPYAASILSTPDILKKNLESKNVSKRLTQTIIKAMSPRKEDRYKCVADFMKSLGLKVNDYHRVIKEPEVTVVIKTNDKKSDSDTQSKPEQEQKKPVNNTSSKQERIISTKETSASKSILIRNKKIFILAFLITGVLTITLTCQHFFAGNTTSFMRDNSDTTSNDFEVGQSAINKNEKDKQNVRKIPNDFVLVPGGLLKYNGNYYEDGKKHNVMIDSFYICKYELTQLEYKKIMGELKEFNYSWLVDGSWYIDVGPKYNKIREDSVPVRGTYVDFIKYCNKLSENEGYDGFYVIEGKKVKTKTNGNGYRLTTPYEWIFAAYGGTINQQDKYLGGKNLDQVAWHYGNSGRVPHPVGKKRPNILGLYDIQGNVPELLQGDEKQKYYSSMVGGYNVSNYNYPQTYDPRYIWGSNSESDLSECCYGTRIVFIPKNITNRNLEKKYDY